MAVIVQQGQNLMDIAIQSCGSATALFALAVLNGLSVTDDVSPGTILETPVVVNRGVAQYFLDKGIVPASNEASAKFYKTLQGGIGYMQIGFDFKVS